MSLGTFWLISSFSFVVALSGALVPGPLLTYTIMKTLETKRRGAHVGAFVIVGHAILEGVLVVALLAGFASLLKNELTIRIIGTIGGMVLVFLGSRLAYDLIRGKVQDVFLNAGSGIASREEESAMSRTSEVDRSRMTRVAANAATTATNAIDAEDTNVSVPTKTSKLPRPIVGGILVSMSNPYWWVWWASIGLAFMVQYDVSFQNPARLLAFFTGHELGDLAVYWMVSVLVALGKKRIGNRTYRAVLFVCALVMVGFGLFLGIKPHI